MQNLVVSRSCHTLGVRIRTAGVVVPRYGSQPVVERPATQGQALAHHAERPAVVQGDRGVEAAPAVELHVHRSPFMLGESEAARR